MVRVSAEIVHLWIGDLRIELVAPSGARSALRDQVGGGGDDLSDSWDWPPRPSPLAASARRARRRGVDVSRD